MGNEGCKMSELLAWVVAEKMKGTVPKTVREVRAIEGFVFKNQDAFSEYEEWCRSVKNRRPLLLESGGILDLDGHPVPDRYPKLVELIIKYGL
jgi:hypothetical protein